jgi:lysyl-tRNA synthetase, class I
MQWIDKLISSVDPGKKQIINDSKTPSGRVHVGALRGVLIHDAVYRELRSRGVDAAYIFGVDDYDPLDELPAGHQEYFAPYLGQPLCNVPAPPGSTASDLAEHYISEFFDVFAELGVGSTSYRMRDVYRSGRFNEAILTILARADVVRRVYKEVSNSERPGDWYPFNVVCERCGRIGTTQVYHFDGERVSYRCRPDLVAWAAGCGHSGAISPLDGRGKLPWKLEWVAKWHTFGVTIEGAGKDHTTRGGSREVAAACLREIFGENAPRNIPYEFFLVGGAKMSSSRGVGASAREIASLLPPEVLRFLILKSPPNRPVNFSPEEEQLVKLFNEYDRLRARVVASTPDDESTTRQEDAKLQADRRLLALCQVEQPADVPAYEPPFQLLTTLLQMPHIDVVEEIGKRKGTDLTESERRHLLGRIASARYWLEHYASEEEKFQIQTALPASVNALSNVHRAYLHRLGEALPGVPWTDESLQSLVYDIARLTPIRSAEAFEAIYLAFLDRRAGPRAGSLLGCLERQFVTARLSEVPHSLSGLWLEGSESLEDFEQWLVGTTEGVKLERFHFELFTFSADFPAAQGRAAALSGVGVLECSYVTEGKKAVKRARFSSLGSADSSVDDAFAAFEASAKRYVAELAGKAGLTDVVVTCSSRHEDLRARVSDLFRVSTPAQLSRD